jgi:two-component system response regulator NreC
MDKIRVLLADDHAVLRAGLRLLLDSQDDMEVVGEVATGAQAVAQARQLHPDIVLLDITMSGADGLGAVREIKEDNPNTKVLSAIRAVHQGGTFLHPEHAKALLEPSVETAEELEKKGSDSYDLLSDREQQVLKFLALGHTNKQIAEKLFISVKTVETYRARVQEKLGLRGRAALVRYALQRGLLAGEEE